MFDLQVRQVAGQAGPCRGAGRAEDSGCVMGEHLHFRPEDKALARELLAACPLSRDRLPYQPEFDALLAEFNRRSGQTMGAAVFWRLLSSSAKLGGLAKRKRP